MPAHLNLRIGRPQLLDHAHRVVRKRVLLQKGRVPGLCCIDYRCGSSREPRCSMPCMHSVLLPPVHLSELQHHAAATPTPNTHLEHFVGLVKHQDADAAHVQHPLL